MGQVTVSHLFSSCWESLFIETLFTENKFSLIVLHTDADASFSMFLHIPCEETLVIGTEKTVHSLCFDILHWEFYKRKELVTISYKCTNVWVVEQKEEQRGTTWELIWKWSQAQLKRFSPNWKVGLHSGDVKKICFSS